MKIEQIKFERAGGFTGVRINADFVLSKLPEEQADRLIDLLDDADFHELPEQIPGDSSKSDSITYTVTVIADNWEHTITTEEDSAPEELRALLQYLFQLSINKRKND